MWGGDYKFGGGGSVDEIPPNNRLAGLSDDELVERAQVRPVEGQIPIEVWEAWVVLYVRYNNHILNTILGYLGSSQLESVAVDLTDGTFTKAFDALPKKKKESPFAAWLTVIARHETLKWFEQKATSLQAYTERQEEHQLSAESASWVFLVGTKLEQPADIELRELIELAKNTLSNREYQVFVLYYEEGLGIEEIASKLGAKPKTVRQTLWRATVRFKLFYEGPRPSTRKKKRKKASDGLPPSDEKQPQPIPHQRKEGGKHG
jgi:RNA polymerase sigma factor (sigma-70 family)